MPNKENELLKQIEELKNEIKSLKKRKKYGLVWENKPEQVVLDCQNKLPILKEVKNREIKTDKNKPVNILIEGDNYHSLSVLNYTHKGKIDVIYIDPPYNTGSENFIYNDNRYNNVKTDDPYRHSKWISLMNKRLRLAKELLSDKGVIFISIDDNEVAQLKLLCDEIFGEKNFIANLIITSAPAGTQSSTDIAIQHSYCLFYKKSTNFISNKIKLNEDEIKDKYSLIDSFGHYYVERLWKRGIGGKKEDVPTLHFPVYYDKQNNKILIDSEIKKIKNKKKIIKILPYQTKGVLGRWTWSRQKMINERNLLCVLNIAGEFRLHKKVYLQNGVSKKAFSIINSKIGRTEIGSLELKNILNKKIFDYPKSSIFIKYLLSLAISKNSIILDFFAGSGTTGHAVLELNKEDGGNRKFILCTNNENKIAEEICYPRVSKVIKGYKNKKGDKIEDLGGNLKYYKTDFVDSEHINKISDDSKIKLTYQAGEMIALREETLDEIEKNEWWQIFTDGEKQTAIYFKEDKSKLKKLIEKLSKNKKSVLYIFSWGKNEYKNEFSEHKNIRIEDIPEPILEVYKELNKL
jgi:adenine-specific DNA-methyltransferase